MGKGYYVPNGYMGFVKGKYILFASESDYLDYMEELNVTHQPSMP